MPDSPYTSPETRADAAPKLVGGKHQTVPFDIETMPPGVPYIVGNEAAERFSYYGMKAILTVFMTKHLLDVAGQPDVMTDEQAKAGVHLFSAAVYFTPFLGAIISDWLWGKYRTILYLSLLYCAGHGVLAMLDFPQSSVAPKWILYAGLVLIALGAGGIKPCVTAHVGDQFGKRNQHLLSKVYGWFYFSINFGSMFSTLLTPLLLANFGPAWAFGVPGVLMAIATFLFWLGRNRFVHVPAGGNRFFKETFGEDGLRAMLNLTPLLLLVAMFWSLFDQTASAWVIQADKMNLSFGSMDWGGRTIELSLLPSQLQAANPLFVMILIPLFGYGLYPALGRLFELTPLRKIGIGLFITAGAFAISAWIQMRIDADQTPHIMWQVVAYLVLTAAEVMVSITMLEFFYTQAPKRMKSLIMAFCMLSIFVGNLFTAVVNVVIQNEDGTSKLPGASYYWFFTVAMLVTAVAYVVWSQFYRGQTYIQGDDVHPIEEAVGEV